MKNRTVSFRFPQELINTLEVKASHSGKTKTDLVIEAVAEVYGASKPISATATISSVQQQIDALRKDVETLATEGGARAQAYFQGHTSNFVAAIQQALQSLKDFNSLLGEKIDTNHSYPPNTEMLEIVADSTPDTRSSQPSLPDTLQHLPQTTLLTPEAASNPQQLSLQIQYQLQVFDPLFSAIPELVFVCDRSGHFTYVSPFAMRVWGVTREELLGQIYHTVNIPSEFLDFNLAQFGAVLSFGKMSATELAVAFGNSVRYYDYNLSPIRDDVGTVIGVVGNAIDVTHRKQSELDLQEAFKRCRNLFEFANDLIFIVDAESHRIIDANLKAARRLRYTRKELCQMTLEDIEPPDSAIYFETAVIPQLERNGSAIFTHSLRRKDGNVIPVEVSVRLTELGDRLAYQSFARDIHNRMAEHSTDV